MRFLDWFVLSAYFLLMVGIGFWSYNRVHGTKDFFAAGGKLPWWLSGISHHMSSYSAVLFTGFAAIAYTHGITIYFWYAIPVFIAVMVGAFLIAPRWARLRSKLGIESPTEYLRTRYNLPTQQLLAWSGSLLKVFDVGAKYAAIALILHVVAGAPLLVGILLSGGVGLIYVVIGGLWADVLTDLSQFIIQVVATLTLFFAVFLQLGGLSEVGGMWNDVPEGYTQPFVDQYTPAFAIALGLASFISYSGGTWNLAQRFIASPQGSDARKAAYLSAALYLVVPIIVFFPIWGGRLLFPDLEAPDQIYGVLTRELLPPGMLGLVVAAMFAATMSMVASDSNAVSAVLTRDILPMMGRKLNDLTTRHGLAVARVTTLLFTALTIVVAIFNESFGGIIGLIVTFFAGLIGPAALPLILGLLPAFKHSGPTAAIVSVLGGFTTFAIAHFGFEGPYAVTTGIPLLVSATLYIGIGALNRQRPVPPEVTALLDAVESDDVPEDRVTSTA